MPEAELNYFFKEILLIIINFCITMSGMELVFQRAERQCSGSLFSMLLFKKIVFDANFQSISLHKKDDTCPLLDTNISA